MFGLRYKTQKGGEKRWELNWWVGGGRIRLVARNAAGNVKKRRVGDVELENVEWDERCEG